MARTSQPPFPLRRLIEGYGLSNAEEWGGFVNEFNESITLKAAIPHLCWKVKNGAASRPRLIGELGTDTGEFHGHVDQFETFGSEITAGISAAAKF